jgi:alpha-beta hydrolase superfamily lysophospholipase
MKTETWNWKSEADLELFARDWVPDGKARAVVCLVHGLGEHSGRYEGVGTAFTKGGLVLSGFDLRGHGRSSGQRGHFPSLAAVMGDIHTHIRLARERHPGIPAFLFGHSLGGLLVLAYGTYHQHDLCGVIANAPALRTPVLEQRAKISLAKLLGGLLPTMSIPTGLIQEDLSRDPRVVQAYKDDPLVHGVGTLAAARAGLVAVEWAFAHAAAFPVPLLLMHGSEDVVAYPWGSQEFAGLVEADCTLRMWEGLHHETHNEPEKAQVVKYALDWIKARIKKK